MANNVPLRGAKFGVFEGGVRSHSFLWGPDVLPDGAAGKVYEGMFHLVDYYSVTLTTDHFVRRLRNLNCVSSGLELCVPSQD